MRVSREVAEENRRRVIASSSQLFRERGFDGIGIADLMQAAGLTHGGFYKQFASKEDLIRAACEHAMTENLSFWREKLGNGESHGDLMNFVRAYLSSTHREQPEHGCFLSTLASEAPRHEEAVRHVFVETIEAYCTLLSPLLAGGRGTSDRDAALATLSQMVGALSLARAVPDQKLASEILEASIRSISDRAASATSLNSE